MTRLFLQGCIREDLTQAQIARRGECSITNVRHFLRKFNLRTRGRLCTTSKKGTTFVCTTCGKEAVNTGHGSKRCNTCLSTAKRKNKKDDAIRLMGGCCSICGYHRCSRSLVFHHRDPSEKKFEINGHELCRSWDEIKIELKKTILLCANCHGEVHDKIVDLPRIV